MRYSSFSQYIAVQEGLLVPDKAPAAGLPRSNATAMTDAQRKRLKVTPVPSRTPGPVIHPVVPPKLIPRNLSPSDVTARTFPGRG